MVKHQIYFVLNYTKILGLVFKRLHSKVSRWKQNEKFVVWGMKFRVWVVSFSVLWGYTSLECRQLQFQLFSWFTSFDFGKLEFQFFSGLHVSSLERFALSRATSVYLLLSSAILRYLAMPPWCATYPSPAIGSSAASSEDSREQSTRRREKGYW